MINQKKKLLVCGAGGFIGRNMAEYFAAKDEFEVYGTYLKSEPLSNSRVKMIQADLTNKADVKKVVSGMDIIIQAAATTSGAKEISEKPYYHVTDNAIMNSLIFRAAFDFNVAHVIFFSCTVMYQTKDQPFLDVPVKETDYDANKEIHPKYFGVGWTKVYLEKVCEFYSRIGKTKYTVLRHSNIYGPYDKYDLERSHVFGATVTKVLTAKDGKLVVWGEGKEERDLLHVDDLVEFVDVAIRKQQGQFGLYNVGQGSSVSVRELVEKVIKHSGRELNIEYDTSKPSIPTKLAVDCSKAKEEFGWVPKISLDEGIQKTLAWHKEHYHLEH